MISGLSEDGEEVADFVFAAIDHMPGGCLVDGTRDISTELLETATQLFQQRFRGEGCFDRHIGLLSHEPCKDYDRFDHQKLLHSIDAPENFATPSMSEVGQCWDNAPMESFFGRLKCELASDEMFTTRSQARAELFEYLEVFYNRVRLHSSLGFLSPVEFERAHNQTHR